MKFMLLIYNDTALLDALPPAEADGMMRDCLAHADELRRDGRLIESQMLEGTERAKSVRIRGGRQSATDGPFSEAKEVLGGFNLIDAADMDEAVRIAAEFPWARTGCVEVRPVRDIEAVRRRVYGSEPSSPRQRVSMG
jgi:hypothetical protein